MVDLSGMRSTNQDLFRSLPFFIASIHAQQCGLLFFRLRVALSLWAFFSFFFLSALIFLQLLVLQLFIFVPPAKNILETTPGL